MKARLRVPACCILCAMAAWGCYEDISPPQQPPQPQAAKPAPVHPAGEFVGQGGGAALGGAQRAAGNLVDKAQKESEKAADEVDPYGAKPAPDDDDE